MKFLVVFDSLILYHLPSSCEMSFFLLGFYSLEKSTSVKLFFNLSSSHFRAITSIFWRIWNEIYDRCSSKIPDQAFCSQSMKCPGWQQSLAPNTVNLIILANKLFVIPGLFSSSITQFGTSCSHLHFPRIRPGTSLFAFCWILSSKLQTTFCLSQKYQKIYRSKSRFT